MNNSYDSFEKSGRSFWARLLYDLTHTSALSRFLFFILADVFIIILSLYLSFLVHFDFNFQVPYAELLREVLLFFIVLKIGSFTVFRIYRITWRYVGVADLLNIVLAVVIAEMALLILSLPNSFFHLPITGLAKRIFLVDGFFTLAFISGLRVSKKLYMEVIREKTVTHKGKRTLIIGAGNTGEMLIRDMARNGFADYYPIGFLDDDRMKVGTYVHGVKVLGKVARLGDVISQNQVVAVIIAIPSLNHQPLRELYESARKSKVGTIKVVPRIYDFDKPDISLKGLEDISIEDLVGRQVISVDYRGIRDFLEGKSVLVTGAGGSIGMEIVTQVCAFGPRRLVLFEIDETELHNLGLRLGRLFPHLSGVIEYVTGDVRDEGRVREVFGKYRPEIVFHAAAYKHVPLMEENPCEAILVNVRGSMNVAEASLRYRAEKMIMVSTDKAVNPTNIMGASKRLAEIYIQSLGMHISKGKVPGCTRYITTRFGNVLGSNGSVVPRFREQIEKGGPVTVTHPEITRYFMTIPEACRLVLEAAAMGGDSEIYVFDMGTPVKISELARRMIELAGYQPDTDIKIKYTGFRPGEKLYEEVLSDEENTLPTKHPKIRVAQARTYEFEAFNNAVEPLLKASRQVDIPAVVRLVRKLVPEYKAQNSWLEKV